LKREDNQTKKSILIRCDAGFEQGLGHLSRCSVLCSEALRNDIDVSFLVKTDDRDKVKFFLDSRGLIDVNLNLLPARLDIKDELDIIDKIVTECRADLAILDHYNTSISYCRTVKEFGVKLLQFDYKADSPLIADIILNPNPGAIYLSYDGLVGRSQKVLSGMKYALISDSFKKLKSDGRAGKYRTQITFALGGGENAVAVVSEILESVKFEEFAGYDFHLPEFKGGNRSLKMADNLRFYKPGNRYLDAIKNADLVICNAGVTATEMLFLEKKVIVIDMADNQKLNWLFFNEQFRCAFTKTHFIENFKKGDDLFKKCLNSERKTDNKVPDGKGAERVIKQILSVLNKI
jgi:UDP-2,4-diacetamido-2,4,6-trideoxy-beta-L-altropyranose hydrolase